jgi:WD40-like Beta Propeller Repeat
MLLVLLAVSTAASASQAIGSGSVPITIPMGPTLNLPWAEHGRLSEVTGRSPLGWNQDAYVVPQRPGRNLVRYFGYDWRYFDYLEEDGSAGVRLYYYDREYPVARIAGGLIRETWRYLTDRFQYRPSFRVPYILYNTYREFLETNVFQVEEGTLGVTSPQDLRMTLSYSGERGLFKHVSTHEMTHQFMIQKVSERATTAGVENPIGAMPLWFIEGLAEYYAYDQQMDSDTEMFLRDVILNPIAEVGWTFPNLEEDRPQSFHYTYKFGQARLVFLAETYGERVIQGVLDQTPRLSSGGGRRGEQRETFSTLLGRVAGETPAQMNSRWSTWARKRVMKAYLDAKQDLPDVTELKLPDPLDGFVSSRDGNLLFYRGFDRETFRAKLVLLDRRDPGSQRQIAIDQQPGTESLHPLLWNVMAVADDGIAWISQSGDSDLIHYRALERVERREPESPRVKVELKMSETRVYHVVNDGLIEARDPTLSPDGTQLAFYGLDRDGKIDIYTLNIKEKEPHVRRLTEDLYAERDLSWGDDGIVYASDATESGKYNLFRIDPVTGARTRLTDSPVDQRGPVALPGGAVIYSSNANGKDDLWFLQNGRIKRLTDFPTGISHPGLGPSGVYGMAVYGARSRLFETLTADMLSLDEQDAIPSAYVATVDKPMPFGDEVIPMQNKTYNPYAVAENWRVEGGGASIGGAGFGGAPVGSGGVLFADVLRDRTTLVNFAIYGSFNLTDALAFYVDKSERLVWGLGVFHTFEQGRDTQFPSAQTCFQPLTVQNLGQACQVIYLQTETGLEGLLSYPLSTFGRVEGSVRLMGVQRSFFDNFAYDRFGSPIANLPASDLAQIKGGDPEGTAQVSYGWDTTRYGPGGAIGGTSFEATLGAGDLPTRGNDGFFAFFQEDLIQSIRLVGRSKIDLRVASGLAQGSRFGRRFFLSSFDNLRGFQFGDARLLGDGYYVGQAELQIPLDIIIRFAFFSGITGVVGWDFGGVFDTNRAKQDYAGQNYSAAHAALAEAWANRTADYVLGVNFGLGPFELRVQFAHGVDVGGLIPQTDQNGHPTWVPNISLHYAYF